MRLQKVILYKKDKVIGLFVYFVNEKDQTIDDIPSSVLDDCVQLVKANSIEGNKINNIEVVYTPVNNLKKTSGMDVGQVGFHKDKEVEFIYLLIISILRMFQSQNFNLYQG